MRNKLFACSILLILIPMFIGLGYSEDLTNETLEIKNRLGNARKSIQEMIKDELPVVRYNDTLLVAKQMWRNQMERIKNNKTADFSFVKSKLDELREIRDKAYRTNDQLQVLENTLNQTQVTNLTPAFSLYEKAEDEFYSERYDRSSKLIEKTYKKISELKSMQAKLGAFYEATSRNLINFLLTNWKKLVVGGIIALIIFWVSHKRVSRYLIKKRIAHLKRRKGTINKLIQKTQREYFEAGTIPESTYRIRTKKYGDLIRDINRQIPTLEEELQRRKRGEFKGSKKERISKRKKGLKRKVKKKEQAIKWERLKAKISPIKRLIKRK